MRIAELLELEGVDYDMETHGQAEAPETLPRVIQARPHQVVKSVLVHADDRPVMCAVPWDRDVDFKALRFALECRDVRLANRSEIERICTGYEFGAVPPVGRLFGIPTLMDESLRDEQWVYFQAGTHRASIIMSELDLERVSQAEVISITAPPSDRRAAFDSPCGLAST